MNGKVYDYRHPIWNTWWPPNGFSCRCFCTSLSARQMAQRGLKESTAGVDVQPDEGWRYNVGEESVLWDKQRDLEQAAGTGAVFREVPGQKTYLDYGRPDVRQVPKEMRLVAPERIPAAEEIGREAALDAIYDAVGIEAGEMRRIVETGDGGIGVLDRELLAHLLDAADGREIYARYIVPTLQDPYEVWLTEYGNDAGNTAFRKRYIGLFMDDRIRDYLVVLDLAEDGAVFWNAFSRERAKINKMRKGLLLHGKGG
jgi:hypothetical protein